MKITETAETRTPAGTAEGPSFVEQSGPSTDVISAEQIVLVIREVHACYDYSAA
jgi:hypothetical protein